jgi:hypothetical protein
MDEVARLLTLLALTGGALTLVGAAFAQHLDETRRIQRTLTQGLGATPQPMLVARGRGAGVGFDLTRGLMVTTWNTGGWRLTYRVDELIGMELIVDRQVAARAFRGEARRPLEQLPDPRERVRLRLVFDDAVYPEFLLDLWLPGDEGRRGRMDAQEALAEANRWLARLEAILRRGGVPRPTPAATVLSPPPPTPLFDEDQDDRAEQDVTT